MSLQEERYRVSTTGNQSSGSLSSLIPGNGLMKLAPEATLAAGDETEVILLDRGSEQGCVDHGAA